VDFGSALLKPWRNEGGFHFKLSSTILISSGIFFKNTLLEAGVS